MTPPLSRTVNRMPGRRRSRSRGPRGITSWYFVESVVTSIVLLELYRSRIGRSSVLWASSTGSKKLDVGSGQLKLQESVVSDHTVLPETFYLLGAEAEQSAVDLLVVLAEPWRAALDGARRAREARIHPLHAHRAEHRVVHRLDIGTRGDVRIGEDVGGRVRDAERHLVALEDVLDLARRARLHPGGDDAVDLVAVLRTAGHRLEARIGEQVLAPDGAREAGEQPVAGGDDADVLAVARLPVVERRGVAQPVALPLADDAEPVVGRERVLHDPQDRLVEREIDPLSARRGARLAGTPVALVDRAQNGEGVEHPRQIVGDDEPGSYRRPVGIAGDVHQAAHGDPVPVEAGAVAVRAVLAVHGHARENDAGVERREGLVAEAPRFERAGLEVLDDDVGQRHEALQQRLPGRLAQVERHRALAPPLDGPEERLAPIEGTDRAHEVPLPRQLHLDDVGAEVGEQRRREGRADTGAQVEDAEPDERTGWLPHAVGILDALPAGCHAADASADRLRRGAVSTSSGTRQERSRHAAGAGWQAGHQ